MLLLRSAWTSSAYQSAERRLLYVVALCATASRQLSGSPQPDRQAGWLPLHGRLSLGVG